MNRGRELAAPPTDRLHRPLPSPPAGRFHRHRRDAFRAIGPDPQRKVRAIGSSTTPASDIIEAQWVAERRGLERFRTEQPPYSIVSRGIEAEILPITQRYGLGTLVWGPLAQGMLTGRARKASKPTCTAPP